MLYSYYDLQDLLGRLVVAYDLLQQSDGAHSVFPGSTSNYTVGHWLGARMAGLVDQAREAIESEATA